MTQSIPFRKTIRKQTLAEQVAEAIQEAILSGDFAAGAALPTEPALSQQFGISRAVVRDATRMLAAQGLVRAEHGRGVFVTDSQTKAFGDALLLALRRAEATVWDIEHFEQIIYPEVFALATQEATEEELEEIEQLGEAYLNQFSKQTLGTTAASQPLLESYRTLNEAIFASTHNAIFALLARPLLNLRNVRSWQGRQSIEEAVELETHYVHALLTALKSRDPDFARTTVADLLKLPPAAVSAMRQTPIGEVVVILDEPTQKEN